MQYPNVDVNNRGAHAQHIATKLGKVKDILKQLTLHSYVCPYLRHDGCRGRVELMFASHQNKYI